MATEPEAAIDPLASAAAAFAGARRRLFGLAYRMLGSVAEAEDLLQEVWLRWQACDRSVVLDPAAFLTTMTTRLAINAVQSARVRREAYVGPWLPEPVSTEGDPELGAERTEALQLAVLLLLERLSPSERAAYVLREAFDYSYEQVAEVVQVQEANARQLVSRAKKHLESAKASAISPTEQRRLLSAFLAAAQSGDTAALTQLFAAEIVSYSDGGGAARAVRVPVAGRDRVAKFIASFAGFFWTDVEFRWLEANGQPAVQLNQNGSVLALVTISASSAGIEQIQWLMAPAKLAHFSP